MSGVLGAWGLSAVLILALLLVQTILLSTKGQTVGKKCLGIRIVQANGADAGFVHAVLLRVVVMGVINGIVGKTSFVDPLFIFREDRRCLHDLLAGTVVIEA